jgi:MFS family permease
MVGLAISCFSVAQMTFAPILVGLSLRIGRSIVLRICLAGAAASSLLIAFSGSIAGVIAGRTLAGVFAACVPVAQSGVTDILSPDQMAIGLSRVSAAAQLGVVVGPAASSIFQETFAAMGLPPAQCLPAVFSMSSLFALSVFAQMTITNRKRTAPISAKEASRDLEEKLEENTDKHSKDQANGVQKAQVMLRTITIIMGWTAILSNSIYGLFAPRFMGFQQPQLSATYSFAAIMMVASQVVFPRLVAKLGAHQACTLGILAAGTGIGAQSLIRIQPFHTALYMMNRAGAAIADTSTATLVASSSSSKEDRSRNLALLTSTRAAARIVTPLLSSKLFELSCKGTRSPGSLPFLTATCFALAVAPFPTLLRKAEKRKESLRKIA